MFKSIFGKQYAMYIGTVLLSFILMGTAISQVFKTYYIENQAARLTEQGEKIAGMISERAYMGLPSLGYASQIQILDEVKIFSKYMDVGLVVIGADYGAYFAVGTEEIDLDEINANAELKESQGIVQALSGEIVTMQGTLSGIYDDAKLIVGYPVILGTPAGQKVIGAAFLSTSLTELNANISEVVRMTVLCVIFAGGIAFVLLYISSLSISRPLRQMNDAAKVIANGEFEKRIEVNSMDEVGQLAQSFNYMAKSLEMQENTRREFIANISHDLRSPLTSIIGFLKAMKDGTIGPDKQEHYIDIVLNECIRLSKLANDILDLSKIQSIGDIDVNWEDFEINELIRKTIMQFENRITSKSIDFSLIFADGINVVHGDYEKIQRVIYNFMDNAVKFTPVNGSISLETSIVEDKLYISIKDSGKGLTPEEKSRIFERFYKADASRGYDRTGSGLGLSIAKEFMKAHNEKIFVNSEEGKGCEFIITLSLAQLPGEDGDGE